MARKSISIIHTTQPQGVPGRRAFVSVTGGARGEEERFYVVLENDLSGGVPTQRMLAETLAVMSGRLDESAVNNQREAVIALADADGNLVTSDEHPIGHVIWGDIRNNLTVEDVLCALEDDDEL